MNRQQLVDQLTELEAREPKQTDIGGYYNHCTWDADCCRIRLEIAKLDGDQELIRKRKLALETALNTGD